MKKISVLIMMCLSMFLLNAISLEDSIELAKRQNKEMLAEKSGLEAAEWSRKNALTNFLPKVSFNSMLVRIDDDTYKQATEIYQLPVFGPTGIPTGDFIPFSAGTLSGGFYKTSFSNDITVRQPVFNGGKVILGYQLSALAKQQAELVVIGKEKDLAFAVASTYLNLLKLLDLQTLSRKSLNSTLAHLVNVQKKYELGIANKSALLQWQVKQKNDETALRQIDNNIAALKEYWHYLLGSEEEMLPDRIDIRKYDSEISIYAGMDEAQIISEIERFLAAVQKSSPALQTLDLVDRIMKKNYDLAKGNFLPSLNLQYTYQIENDDKFDFDGQDNWSLAAVFSLPVFQSGANYTNLKKAKHEKKKAGLETAWVRDTYLIAAQNSMRTQLINAQIVEDNRSALEFAAENHRILSELFEQGLITNSELLDAQTMLFGSEMNLTAAYYDYILSKYEVKKYIRQEE